MPVKEPLDYAALTEQALQEATAVAADAPPPPPTAEQKAQNLRATGMAAYLYGALSPLLGQAFDVETSKHYLDAFLKEAGAPTDPVERMLLEQLALAHHVIGRLHVRAGSRESLEEVKAYHTAAARLMGEFRRHTLALKCYREPQVRKPPEASLSPPQEAKGPAGGTNGV